MLNNFTTANGFMERYIKGVPANLKFQKTPLQIYPLEVITQYLVVPFPLIRLDYNVMIFMKSGSITQQLDNEVFVIDQPTVLFIDAGTIHSLQKVSKKIEGYFILIENKTVNAIFNAERTLNLSLIAPLLPMDKELSDWALRLCKLLYEEIQREQPSRKVGLGLLQALLYRILELSGSSKLLPRNQQIALIFKNLAKVYFKEEKSVSFYAKEMAVSANYLNRCVQSVFHKSAKDIIIEVAIVNSQLLMFDSAKDISEVCYELNFEDPSYFSRVFKKVTGQTPTEYKKFISQELS